MSCCNGNDNGSGGLYAGPSMYRGNGVINSWIDIERMCPKEILDVIAYAELAGTPGEFVNSSTYLNSSWVETPIVISVAPTVAANESDNKQKEAEAKQWNMSHKTWNNDASMPAPLPNMVFMRAGIQWLNTLQVNVGGDGVTDMQVSFLLNAGTRGDAQGTVGVLEWADIALANEQTFKFTFKQPGQYCLGFRAISGGNASMFVLDANIVP